MPVVHATAADIQVRRVRRCGLEVWHAVAADGTTASAWSERGARAAVLDKQRQRRRQRAG